MCCFLGHHECRHGSTPLLNRHKETQLTLLAVVYSLLSMHNGTEKMVVVGFGWVGQANALALNILGYNVSYFDPGEPPQHYPLHAGEYEGFEKGCARGAIGLWALAHARTKGFPWHAARGIIHQVSFEPLEFIAHRICKRIWRLDR